MVTRGAGELLLSLNNVTDSAPHANDDGTEHQMRIEDLIEWESRPLPRSYTFKRHLPVNPLVWPCRFQF